MTFSDSETALTEKSVGAFLRSAASSERPIDRGPFAPIDTGLFEGSREKLAAVESGCRKEVSISPDIFGTLLPIDCGPLQNNFLSSFFDFFYFSLFF